MDRPRRREGAIESGENELPTTRGLLIEARKLCRILRSLPAMDSATGMRAWNARFVPAACRNYRIIFRNVLIVMMSLIFSTNPIFSRLPLAIPFFSRIGVRSSSNAPL